MNQNLNCHTPPWMPLLAASRLGYDDGRSLKPGKIVIHLLYFFFLSYNTYLAEAKHLKHLNMSDPRSCNMLIHFKHTSPYYTCIHLDFTTSLKYKLEHLIYKTVYQSLRQTLFNTTMQICVRAEDEGSGFSRTVCMQSLYL